MATPERSQRFECLVTGGAGFIGSHIVARLVALGHGVRVVDNLSTGKESNLTPVRDRIQFLRGDLCDAEVCAQAVGGVDIVFHLAALASVPASLLDPWACHAANVNGTMRLLEACARAKVRRVVYSSSSSVYGDTTIPAKSESAEPEPRSPYAASKLAGEQYVLAFARAGVFEGVALRYFNVFGPRQTPGSAYAAVIPNFLKAALDGTPAELYGDGQQTRDFIYVANVVDANILAAATPAANGVVVNVGAGRRTSLLDLIRVIGDIIGRQLGYVPQPQRAGDVRDSLACMQRAERVLGFRARVTLEDGLRETWQWLAGPVMASTLPLSTIAAAQLA
jgi:UDP-N-acetylglucosamine/UDP-N-acetyl-alpha-D-glucosaminouronate 4-epimerase